MPLRFKSRLLAHLRHERYVPTNVAQLTADLEVDDPDEFRDAVRALTDEGAIVVSDSGMVTLPSYADGPRVIEGEFRGTSKGFGFVKTDQMRREGDLFVPPHLTGDAMTGDRVRVGLIEDRQRGRRDPDKRFSGEVIEVIERKASSFTGTIETRGVSFVVIPDARELEGRPIVLRDAESKYAGVGDKVVFEITDYPEGDALGEGVIVRVLGAAGEPDIETQAVIAAYGLPSREFPEACVEQAREATRAFDEAIERFRAGETLKGRLDLTGEFVTTIDPPDAKDYDDAISLKKLPATDGGGWELAVHIADVGHFIQAGSPLDVEARQRGNSVYLPRLVIPMLPEVLSNGICSLQEGVERFAKTAFIRFDTRANVVGRGVASTIIKSRKRMTYLEAQALIDGDQDEAKNHAKTEPNYTDELIASVREMNRLAKAIEQRRHGQGMISLELPDVELIFDDNGHVVDGQPEDDAYTHKIIEMFMVEANEVLGHLFQDLQVPLIRRIHPDPVPGDQEDMRKSAMVAGFKIPASPSREELQGLLDATRGTPAARAVHMAVLRTLTKAEYSPARIGHYALASEAYAHFTSPIRRYPDLTVHRSLAVFLAMTENGQSPPKSDESFARLGEEMLKHNDCPDEQTLLEAGRHCTQTEQNAASAEADLRKLLVLMLLSNKIGETFRGVVTGVNPRGLFVQIDRFVIDGFIKTSDLPGDVTRGNGPPRWQLDKKSGGLVDQSSGRSYNVGHMFEVSIAHVDLIKRQLELAVADAGSRAAGKSKPTLTLGSDGGGLGHGGGAGFGMSGGGRTGSQRRSAKSKRRDKGKKDYRGDRKGKGKRQ
ncbi:MAG: VacB/RNase II family 3'-5' exoribonuclease [Planctomycetota bacterium]